MDDLYSFPFGFAHDNDKENEEKTKKSGGSIM